MGAADMGVVMIAAASWRGYSKAWFCPRDWKPAVCA